MSRWRIVATLIAVAGLTACGPGADVPRPEPSPSARAFDVASGDATYAPQLDGLSTMYGASDRIAFVTQPAGFQANGGRCLRTLTARGRQPQNPTSHNVPEPSQATPANRFRSPGAITHAGSTSTVTYDDPDGAELEEFIDAGKDDLTIRYVVTRAPGEACA